MKFDFVIGNPPYQDESVGDNKTFKPPIYNEFLDVAYKVADCVEMIHPARFLFNAGNTPKQWNRQMLEDPDLKILFYEQNSSRVFSDTEIKGGIAISYHKKGGNFGSIGIFTPYEKLNSILKKVKPYLEKQSFSDIVITRTAYRLTEKMHQDHPEVISQLSDGHAYDMATNIFDRVPQLFHSEVPQDENKYIQILGRTGNERIYQYIRRDYVNTVKNLDKYKVFLPSASGNGILGETLATPIVAGPMVGATETFISIGAFTTNEEAEAANKYIKTKFCRVLLGVLKITQHITPDKWRYVPMQDFTKQSDVNWLRTIKEIDRQLYKKYGLDSDEIDFIESHVKEME